MNGMDTFKEARLDSKMYWIQFSLLVLKLLIGKKRKKNEALPRKI